MRKFAIAITLTVVFYSVCSIHAQSVTVDTSSLPKEKKKLDWKISAQCVVQNRTETDNKVEILESSASICGAKFTHFSTKRTFTLNSEGGVPIKETNRDYYYGFGAKFAQQLKEKTSLVMDTKLYFTRSQSFGTASAEINRRFGKEDAAFQPFARLSYNFPMQTDDHITHGIALYTGLRSEFKKGLAEVENTSQVITDSGSFIPRSRILIDTETILYFKINRLKVGPKFGYARLISGSFPRKNLPLVGMAISYN